MERGRGFEPPRPAWKAGMLAVEHQPRIGPASFVYSEGSRKQSLRLKLIFVCTTYTINDTLPRGKDRVRIGIPNTPIETRHLSTMLQRSNGSIHNHKFPRNKNSFYNCYAVSYEIFLVLIFY